MIYIYTHDLYNQRTQSVHSYPGTFSCDRDLDHGSREGVHLNLHDLIICYLLYLYPHHAECIETRLVLMYTGIIMHDCNLSAVDRETTDENTECSCVKTSRKCQHLKRLKCLKITALALASATVISTSSPKMLDKRASEASEL